MIYNYFGTSKEAEEEKERQFLENGSQEDQEAGDIEDSQEEGIRNQGVLNGNSDHQEPANIVAR